MSHQPERKQKDCLNCGTLVHGRFCHVCGQENIETKESFIALLKHFIYDILHFDSKFFDTVKDVLFRPGYLSCQYVAGKRAAFLNPIRMYLFTSALFFLVVFSLKDPKTGFINLNETNVALSKKDRREALDNVKKDLKHKPGDTMLLRQLRLLEDTTKAVKVSDLFSRDAVFFISDDDSRYHNLAEYDSLQKTLPSAKKHNWLERTLIKRGLAVNEKYRGNASEGVRHFTELFLHKLPYLLFVSLPFFALILKLLYIRRKTFYYSDHAIFTLHHYIFSFILLMLVFLFSALQDWTHLKLFKFLITLLCITWPVYLFAAMKNFYRQGKGKTFSKFLLLNLLGFLVLLLLFALFLFFTIFQL